MKAQAIAIKRSTLVSALLVGAVIAICSATDVRAAGGILEAQGEHFQKHQVEGVAGAYLPVPESGA